MKKFKTILSIFLTLFTVLSICTISVFADENFVVEYKVFNVFDTETFKTYSLTNTNAKYHFILTNKKLAKKDELYEICEMPNDFNQTVFNKVMNIMYQLGEEFYDLENDNTYVTHNIAYATQLYLLSCLGQNVTDEIQTLLSSTEEYNQSIISFYNLLKEKESEIENVYEFKYTFYAPIDKTNHNQIIVAVDDIKKPDNALILNKTSRPCIGVITVFDAEGYNYLFCTNRNRTAEKDGDYILETNYSSVLVGRELDQEKMQKICYVIDTFSKNIPEENDFDFRIAAQCFVWNSITDVDYGNVLLLYYRCQNNYYQNIPVEEIKTTAKGFIFYNQMTEKLNTIENEDYKLYELHYFKRVPFGTNYQVLFGYTIKEKPTEPEEPILPTPNPIEPMVSDEDPGIYYPPAPQTGDNINLGLWVALLIIFVSTSVILIFVRKRH